MAQMTDAQLQAWLDQHGGEVGRKDIEDEVDDPSGARDAAGNVRKTRRIDRTEITAKDGATLTLRRAAGSLVSSPDAPQYDVVANTPPKTTAQDSGPPGGKPYIDDGPEAGPSGRRWGWNPQTRAYDRDLGSSPSAQKPPEPTTTEKREPVATHPGYTAVQTTNKQTGKTETYYLDPSGNRVNGLPEKPTTAALVGSPTGNTRQETKDGKTIKEAEYVLPNGTRDWRSQTEVKPQIPTNVPPFVPDWQKPGLGIVEYANAIRQRPDLTDDQKKDVITTAHTNATATLSQANTLVSAQGDEAGRRTTERGQDVSLANQRLSTSSTNFGNALQAAQAGTKYSVGPNAGAVLPYYLAQAAGQAAAYGGFNTPPPVAVGPALQQTNQMGIPGLPTVLGNNGPWGSGGSVVNPINAGAPGQPGALASAAPLLGPPPAALAAPPAAPPAPDPAVPAPALAAPPPTLPQLPEATPGGGPPAPPPIPPNPKLGQPGDPQWQLPPNEVTMAPTVTPSMAAMLGAGPWAQQQAQPDPTGMAQMVAMQGQQALMSYDPRILNQEALADGFDPDVVALFGGGLG